MAGKVSVGDGKIMTLTNLKIGDLMAAGMDNSLGMIVKIEEGSRTGGDAQSELMFHINWNSGGLEVVRFWYASSWRRQFLRFAESLDKPATLP